MASGSRRERQTTTEPHFSFSGPRACWCAGTATYHYNPTCSPLFFRSRQVNWRVRRPRNRGVSPLTRLFLSTPGRPTLTSHSPSPNRDANLKATFHALVFFVAYPEVSKHAQAIIACKIKIPGITASAKSRCDLQPSEGMRQTSHNHATTHRTLRDKLL